LVLVAPVQVCAAAVAGIRSAATANHTALNPAVPALNNAGAASLFTELPPRLPRGAACSEATTHAPLLGLQIVL
jgi:hypothetical protein